MKLGHRANERFGYDAEYRSRLSSATAAAKRADEAWRYYARKVGIDPLAFEGSPLGEIAKRLADIENTGR